MPLVTMKELLVKAHAGKYAVGAFNIFDHLTLAAVVQAAEEENSPAIIQTTASSTVKYYDYKPLFNMVNDLASKSPVPFAIHLDHCEDKEMVKRCIDNGWTSVMFDGSALPYDKNIEISREICEYAKPHNVTVEGELGAIKGVEDDISVDESKELLADPDKALEYVTLTGIDALAPAIGTAHGVYKGEPKLDFERLDKIVKSVKIPVVIHGGTGLSEAVFKRLIEYGGCKINVSTQIKIAFVDGLRNYMNKKPEEYNPLRLIKSAKNDVKEAVRGFIRIFGSSNKA